MARTYRLPIRFQMPATDDESIEAQRRWQMENRRLGAVSSFYLQSSIFYLPSNDIVDLRSVAAKEMIHAGSRRDVLQKPMPVAVQQIHVPLERCSKACTLFRCV